MIIEPYDSCVLSLFGFWIHLKIMKLTMHVLWARARFNNYISQRLNSIVYCLNFDLDFLMDSLKLR